MIFDIFNTKKKKGELVADSIGKFLSYEIVLIEKMIKGNKKVEIVDIFSLGYTFYLSLTSAIKEGLEGDDAFYAAMGVLIGVFKYKSEREQQRLFNRIKTCKDKNSKEFNRGQKAAFKTWEEFEKTPNSVALRWYEHISDKIIS